ncbi:helix-turn-helix domain-containing protein [Kribbella sp. NPDC051137]|uniref:helix-turn-helix domain-containing protein n=1 Tax=Kribbella sp. NPDC051137 TaxID=3155045 RepID=UPI00343BBD7B
MGRKPLPLGTWGAIRTYVSHRDKKGKADRYRSVTYFRDFDGITRQVPAYGATRTEAESNLKDRCRERVRARGGGSLTAMDRFSAGADLWYAELLEKVADGTRSTGTRDAYDNALRNHVLPVLKEIRFGEFSVPLVDKVIKQIKKKAGVPTAKTSRSVISGVLQLAVLQGAMEANPVREIGRIEGGQAKRHPRGLEADERQMWFHMLNTDAKAIEADLFDITVFMLGTGVRIGETLGVIWEQVNFFTSEVEITHQIVRPKREGLRRTKTKSRAGERVLKMPSWCVAMLRARFVQGVRLTDPVFPDSAGGFRDPSNTRRSFREARSPIGSELRRDLGRALKECRQAARLTQKQAAVLIGCAQNRVSLMENGRVRIGVEEIERLLDVYSTPTGRRAEVVEVAGAASAPVAADAMAWITSHAFRKTTATVLDDAGQSARQIADQLGHARPSLTQDAYIGRKAKNPAAADALEAIADDLK